MLVYSATQEPFTGTPNLDRHKVARLYRDGVWTDADLALHGLAYAPDPEPEPQPKPPRPAVAKSTVQGRVIAAGKAAEAFALLQQQPEYLFRWLAPDRPVVYCDDADAVALVTALGLDPAAILAPDGGP